MSDIESAFDTVLGSYVPEEWKPHFHLFFDRQQRPTVGATVEDKSLLEFSEIRDDLFLAMLKAVNEVLKNEIPEDLDKVYLSFSSGCWKRKNAFTVKGDLPTKVYLALARRKIPKFFDELPDRAKQELMKRERKEYRRDEVQTLFDSLRPTGCNITELLRNNNFCVGYHKELNYPLIFVYQINSKNGEIVTSFAFGGEIFAALKELDSFVRESPDVGQKGYCISMIIPSVANPEMVSRYQAVAVIDEAEFARFTRKSVDAVKSSWGYESMGGRKYF